MPSMLSCRKVCGVLLLFGLWFLTADGLTFVPWSVVWGGVVGGWGWSCAGCVLFGVELFLAAEIIAFRPGSAVATSEMQVGQLQFGLLDLGRFWRWAHEMCQGSPQLMQRRGVGFLIVFAIVLSQCLHLGFVLEVDEGRSKSPQKSSASNHMPFQNRAGR